jgi:2-phosphoglycerate kinase
VSQETKQDVIRSDRAEKPTVVLSRFESARNPVDPGDPSLDDLVDPVQMEGSEGEARASRVGVDDDGVRRPFMLGILVHSLTESGLSFEDAYAISRQIWGRIQDRMLVTKQELRELVAELAGAGRVAVPDETATPALGGPLEVLGSNGRWPFNQTRIQQSFLAAGLEPARAFELVSEIEWRLRGLGSAVVTRDAIRDLAIELVTDQFGASAAARYRAYRRYQNEDTRPVILLLGGTSGVGKSSLALEVARRLSIGRLLSTDSIRDVMRVMVSQDLVPTLHVSSFEAHTRIVREDSDDVDPVIEGFLEQTRTVSVGVRAVIERAVVEGTSLVIDGVSLVPGALDLEEWSERAHVFFLLAADVDRESLHGHLMARADGPGTRASERYVRNFQEIFRIQEALLERAEVFGIPIVDVQDLEPAVQAVVKHVVGGLHARREAERAALD